jgi:hypothetical protein
MEHRINKNAGFSRGVDDVGFLFQRFFKIKNDSRMCFKFPVQRREKMGMPSFSAFRHKRRRGGNNHIDPPFSERPESSDCFDASYSSPMVTMRT